MILLKSVLDYAIIGIKSVLIGKIKLNSELLDILIKLMSLLEISEISKSVEI